MAYTVRRSKQARKDIRNFFRYLRCEAGESIALKYLDALDSDIARLIPNHPHSFGWFHETGSPYHAKLFRLARTTYWIIYTVDDETRSINILRFWNSAREPNTHEL
jgi:plasmid stabilization system protein ParE